MNTVSILSEKWIKASVLGTIWAASEIVLGSFLHNLKVPFSGNILTGIGIIILISVSHVWKEKGLFWRAGIICALMKTMSPSAVIFEPMIAIFSEALLLETGVRLLGKTNAGYFVGAVSAMSWNLFQKIVSLIILYGYNIVNLYSKLTGILQKQLNINFDMLWMPVIILLFIQVLLGFLSALIGIKIGKKLLVQPETYKPDKISESIYTQKTTDGTKFKYSLLWLLADIIIISLSLVLLANTVWFIWSSVTAGFVLILSVRYKTTFQHLLKPKFWIFFFLLTIITTIAFAEFQNNSISLTSGLLIGLQMNFRALIIITGFSALGTELNNPLIRSFFFKTYFKQLPLALELSFESLPSVIATLPDIKGFFKNPVKVFYPIVSQADYRLAELKNKIKMNSRVFILTGSVGQGKTTLVEKIIQKLLNSGISTGEYISRELLKIIPRSDMM